MKKYIVVVISIILVSCGTNDKIEKQNIALQDELNELKFGAPNLLADAKKFAQAKDFVNAKEKLRILVEKHPDRPESAEARLMITGIEEDELWNVALNSTDATNTETYLARYNNGKYAALAKKRIKILKVENEKSEYQNALTQNSSSAWKAFLINYPNRSDISEIRKRIIKSEVDEIMGDKETGQLPVSDRTGSGYSSSSNITITNATECELTVRYSGSDVKMIEIPAGGTQTVYLSSGNYRDRKSVV